MLEFIKYKLANGLTVILNEDKHSNISVVNIMYKVGARNENPTKTGLAHLLEHLMFCGSKNIKDYDKALEKVGAQNNAFTSNDVTNYYIEIPYENLETALWLESDRMINLNITQQNLEIQKNVVSEEFKQCYLNQPYGDAWLELSSLAYKQHPYNWPTIGKNLEHIQSFKLEDLTQFYDRYYSPENAVMVVSGNINIDETKSLIEKWFADIPPKICIHDILDKEPIQTEARIKSLKKDNIALESLYKAFHIGPRFDKNFYPCNLIADILSSGESSLLYSQLVKKEPIFNSISAYTTGTIDPGILIIEGKINKNIDLLQAEAKLNSILEDLKTRAIDKETLYKAKNQMFLESRFEEANILDRSINIAFYESAGYLNTYNQEIDLYNKITADDIIIQANNIFSRNNSSTIYYKLK